MKKASSVLRMTAVTLVLPLALSGCAGVKIHPDFNERHAKMQRITMLPAETEVYEITFNAGPKPLAELQELVKAKSGTDIEETLKTKGYEVTGVPLTTERFNSDPRLKEAWFDIQTLYTQALKDIKENKKREFTYDVGAGPNYFVERHQANVIVLTRQKATKLSEGMKAAQVAQATAAIATVLLTGVAIGGGSQPWHTLQTEIAIVDAESGDILWYNLAYTAEDYTKPDGKMIANHIKQLLTQFPDSKFKKALTSVEKAAKIGKEKEAAVSGALQTNITPKPDTLPKGAKL